MNNLEKRSRKLAYILRHDRNSLPEMKIGGWLPILYLTEERGFTEEEIETLVNTDSKQRFEYSNSKKMIRARYGHSLDIELNLIPSEPPLFLWHGTIEVALASLTEEGISPKSRQFVHLTPNREVATDVGARHGAPVAVSVAAGKMHEDGYKFYHVSDGVWLTKSVPCKYIVIRHPAIDM